MSDAVWHWSGYTLAAVAGAIVVCALFADRARGRRRCRRCWYDLTGLGEVPVTCPECGRGHTKAKQLVRTRRRWRRALVGVVVLLASYGVWTTPRVIERGWSGAVPTAALMVWPAMAVPGNAHPSASKRADRIHGALIAESQWRWESMPMFQKRIVIWCWRATGAVRPGNDFTIAKFLFRNDLQYYNYPLSMVREWIFDSLSTQPVAAKTLSDTDGVTEIEFISIPGDAYLTRSAGEATVVIAESSASSGYGWLKARESLLDWREGTLRLSIPEGQTAVVDIMYRDQRGVRVHAFRVTYALRTRASLGSAHDHIQGDHVLVPVEVLILDEGAH